MENIDEGNMVGDMFVGQFRYLVNNYTVLLLLYFRCNDGFLLFGEETVKCRRGRWSVQPEHFPVCVGQNNLSLFKTFYSVFSSS